MNTQDTFIYIVVYRLEDNPDFEFNLECGFATEDEAIKNAAKRQSNLPARDRGEYEVEVIKLSGFK